MTADAADLITYSQLTVDCFFAEADRLGIANEALRDTATYNRVLESCITRLRAAVAQGVAERLSLVLTPAQAETIARHSLVPSVSAQPVRLTPEESRLAEALYFEAVKAVMAKQGEDLDDGKARQAARTLVRDGQLGKSWWRGHWRGVSVGAAAAALLISAVIGALWALARAAL